ncbi:hypothetical protein [Acidisoma sp.]|uniref:hypothetical protein n=1 Tax=Acidisoma sp. TaxID=1872115 RepID=UPI003B00687A
MTTTATTAEGTGLADGRAGLSKSGRRTLDSLYAHPLARNLEWTDVMALFREAGSVERKANDETVLQLGGEQQMLRRPHSKDLTLDEVMEIRHFLTRVGMSPQRAATADNFLVTIDHHEAHVYHLDLSASDPANNVIKPADPHHFLHHLTHKDQTRERGQRAAEDATYYERIAQAVAGAVPHGKIVVIGHGEGHSDAGHHLIAWIKLHHAEVARHVIGEVTADLSSATPPQLLNIAREAIAAKPE